MQPVKPTNPSEEELISRIRQHLLDHEEPYAPGAWERFDAQKNKRRGIIFWLGGLSSAAAALLLVGGLYFFNRNKQVLQQPTGTAQHQQKISEPVQTQGSAETIPSPQGGIAIAQTKENAPARSQYTANSVKPARSAGEIIPIRSTETDMGVNQAERQLATVKVLPAIVKPAEQVVSQPTATVTAAIKPREQAPKTSFQDFLNKESARDSKPLTASNAKPEKWEMGVLVAPSFGNTKKLNMGYGVSMAYAVSDKVSLTSGISYNELAASKDVGAPDLDATNAYSGANGPPSIVGESKSLSSIETRVVGIDIPLELKYNISKKIYANVGVSAFAVISQRQNNNYVSSRLVQNAGIAGNKDNAFANTLVAEKTTEKAPEAEVSQDKYLGFYNFSFGFKQKVSKSNSIAIEPFMKLPMKEVSKENLRLVGTGLRLKFDF